MLWFHLHDIHKASHKKNQHRRKHKRSKRLKDCSANCKPRRTGIEIRCALSWNFDCGHEHKGLSEFKCFDSRISFMMFQGCRQACFDRRVRNLSSENVQHQCLEPVATLHRSRSKISKLRLLGIGRDVWHLFSWNELKRPLAYGFLTCLTARLIANDLLAFWALKFTLREPKTARMEAEMEGNDPMSEARHAVRCFSCVKSFGDWR